MSIPCLFDQTLDNMMEKDKVLAIDSNSLLPCRACTVYDPEKEHNISLLCHSIQVSTYATLIMQMQNDSE